MFAASGVADFIIPQQASSMTFNLTTSDGSAFNLIDTDGNLTTQLASGQNHSFNPGITTRNGEVQFRDASGNPNFAATIAALEVSAAPSIESLPRQTTRVSGNVDSGDVINIPNGVTVYINNTNTNDGDIANIPSGMTHFQVYGTNTLHGNQLPPGIIDFRCTGLNTTNINIDSLPSTTVVYLNSGNNTDTGDIGNLPSGMTIVEIRGFNTVTGGADQLPAGMTSLRIHGSNTITMSLTGSLPPNLNRFDLTSTESSFTSAMTDRVLEVLAGGSVSNGTCLIAGAAGARTAASDGHVTTLQGRGWTVITN